MQLFVSSSYNLKTMFKKNYFYLSIAIIAMLYNAIQFIFYPELTPKWFIRIIGFLFVIYAICYALDIQKIYLTKKISELDKKIIKNTKLHCFQCKIYTPVKINKDKTLSCSNCGLVHK